MADKKSRQAARATSWTWEYAQRVWDVEYACPTITTGTGGGMMVKILLKNNTKKGYVEGHEGDGVVIDQPNARGRVPEMGYVCPTVNTGGGCGTIIRKNKEEDEMTTFEELKEMQEKHELTVRKITPRECWRLMDLCPIQEDGSFDDTAFDKAKEVNSESQLYKQAGNSICVGVLEAIFEKMFVSEGN